MSRGWTVLRFVIAAIILTAAFMKTWQLATTPSLSEGLLNARWFNILVVEFELFFGIWLIFGMLPRLTWLATVGCFAAFAMVSLYKALSGEASCGCFGTATINPWVTMVFDIAVVGALIRFRPEGVNLILSRGAVQELCGVYQPKPIAIIALSWFVLAVPATYAMLSVKTLDLSKLGEEFIGVDGRKVLTLEPEKWTNKDFTLAGHTDIQNRLDHGVWLVLLHTHTCSSCRESVHLYRELALEFSRNENAPKIAMIELPPYGTEQTSLDMDGPVVHGKLDKSRLWKIKSPVLLLVDDNKVQNVFDNPLDTELIRAIWGGGK